MTDERAIYRVALPLIIEHEIGLDPASLPEHRLLQLKGSRSLQLCESLFWVVTQLAPIPEHGSHVYSPASLNEALESVGQLGQALASAAGEHVERLEQLAEKERVKQKR